VARDGEGIALSFALGGGAPAGQYAAAAIDSGSTDAWDRVVLRARADAPSRVWVQLRLSDSGTGQRWGRSVYLDRAAREIHIPLTDFAPLEPGASQSRPNVAQVWAVLLVVDTVNSAPGRRGRVVIERLILERRAEEPGGARPAEAAGEGRDAGR
jgi:hypothetical protein